MSGARRKAAAAEFLREARRAAESIFPKYRSKHSKKIFTQPQILACVLLKEYLRITYRDLASILAREATLRRALGVDRPPRCTSLWRYAKRIDRDAVTHLLLKALRAAPHLAERLPSGPDDLGHSGRQLSAGYAVRCAPPGILAFPGWWMGPQTDGLLEKPGFVPRNGVVIVRRNLRIRR